jgi:hypothetical protein
MRRAAALAVVVPAVAVLGALALAGARERRALAFPLGVPAMVVAASIDPGHQACQGPIPVRAGFSRVRLAVGTYFRPGPALEVKILDAGTGRRLGAGQLAPGYPDISRPAVSVASVSRGRRIRVCVRNVGDRRVALLGGGAGAAPAVLRLDGRRRRYDASLDFLSAHERSTLATLPAMFRRASLFRPGWVGPWTYWVLVGLVTVAASALLVAAVRVAARVAEPATAPPPVGRAVRPTVETGVRRAPEGTRT